MATVFEINDQIVGFLALEQSLNDFNDWVARNTWNISPNSQTWSLVGRIELALAEYSNGDLTEADLRKRLFQMILVQHLGAHETGTTTTASAVVRLQAGAQAA